MPGPRRRPSPTADRAWTGMLDLLFAASTLTPRRFGYRFLAHCRTTASARHTPTPITAASFN